MSRNISEAEPVVVIKIGGSILVDPAAYHRAAAFIRRRLEEAPSERLLAVVSAENGLTDALQRMAEKFASQPDPAALDLLWCTGELRSVALLAMCLHARRVRVVGLNVHETGLVLPDGSHEVADVKLDQRCLLDALAEFPVVVVPGFFARRTSGAIVSLGRGGSDLTAVLLAAKLRARRCELIKDVPGYFDKDPNRHADAQRLPVLSFGEALEMADAGCDLVQRKAIEAAAHCELRLVVRSLEERAPQSWIGPEHAGVSRDLAPDASSVEGHLWRAREFHVLSPSEETISNEKERTE